MRIAITGARGFIGGHASAHFAARGDAVVPVIVRAPVDVAALTDAFRGADAVVNLAGVVSSVRRRDFEEGNVEAARGVAAAARAANVRLVHVSSLAAAGPAPRESPRVEDDPPAPMNAYGRTKLAGEGEIAAVAGLHWTILRPGIVYGPRDRGLFPLFQAASIGVLPLVGRLSAAYMFIHVSDLVRVIAAAIDRGADEETVSVAHPQPVSPRDLLEQIQSATGGRARILRVPAPVLTLAALAGEAAGLIVRRPMPINRRRYAEMMEPGFVCRVDRLRERWGIVATVGLAEGIASTGAWYREAGWI